MRKVVFANNEIYHVFNRGIERRPTFTNKHEYQRALTTLDYYRFENLPLKLSKALSLPTEQRDFFWKRLKSEANKLIEIICYCLMPNHFHLLLKQKQEEGIRIFLSNFSNSYTRFYNTRHERKGAIFEGIFNGVHIETDEQLLHVSRYIHINPAVSFVVPENDLITYPWSSLGEYLNEEKDSNRICERRIILDFYKSSDGYKQFVFDQIDYGKKLEMIKHLVME